MLMERAGQSVAEILRAHAGGDVRDLDVLMLVGPGNNGGDGRVMGRYLAGWGARVTHFLWKESVPRTRGRTVPAGADLAALRRPLASADIVVDALLGTGHARPLAPTMRQALALVQAERERRPGGLIVLAVDLPSGLNADTGAVDEGTIAADLTVTLAFPKTGLYLFPGAALVGELEVGSIGLPDEMSILPGMEALEAPLVRPSLPARPLESNKGTYGKAMILAGSPQYVGAAFLAASAAGRIGAGLITIATTTSLACLRRQPRRGDLLPAAATRRQATGTRACPARRAAWLPRAGRGSRPRPIRRDARLPAACLRRRARAAGLRAPTAHRGRRRAEQPGARRTLARAASCQHRADAASRRDGAAAWRRAGLRRRGRSP